MSIALFQREVTWGGGDTDTIREWYFDTDTDIVEPIVAFVEPHGLSGEFFPPFGTLIFQDCISGDLVQYTTKFIDVGYFADILHYLNKTVTPNSITCCTLAPGDFSIVKTNNTSAVTPNGSIVITSGTVTISDYEASINGGGSWVSSVGSSITFSGLTAGTYTILIRNIGGICYTSTQAIIADSITYPPLYISESLSHLPVMYSPVFFPITIGFTLDNATGTIKSDVGGTYIEVPTTDGREYLATLPIIRIIGSVYSGKYQVLSVNNPTTPTKFYIGATYSVDENISFVPFDRQVFQLFAEKSIGNIVKIADISVYADDAGEYRMRLEGFLQSVFQVNQPISNGNEPTLLRLYYVVPRDFDMLNPPTVLRAVYSAVPDLSSFLGDLIPLGPSPINFINEQTQKGFPVLFSYIDLSEGRIKNVTSSDQTNIYSTSPVVYIPGIPLNTYDVTWVNPLGAIDDLNSDPALPVWITLQPSALDTVSLHIDTNVFVGIGDYDADDFDPVDYLIGGLNSIVGCYSYEFKDGETTLFTLNICVYPVQSANTECVDGFNIAWINKEGGWSSYVFGGRKTFGRDIGDVKTYKKEKQLRRSSVSNVYDTAEITISVKSIEDLTFIASLMQSVQAYLYSDSTLQWSTPIILDKDDFEIYSTPFKQVDVSRTFKFRYAEEITVQTQ